MLQRALLSLRVDGFGPSVRRAVSRCFGTEQACVFVRHLKPLPTAVTLPVETNGIVVRSMREDDLLDLRVKRYEPRDIARLSEAVVATRNGHIVGAAWYTDSVSAEQPWYRAVEPHLIRPARLTANIFVVPGDKGAAWAIAKSASERLATIGVRSIVGVVGAQNNRSILMSRLLGAKMVARMSVRHRFGRTTTVVEAVVDDRDAGVTVPDNVRRAR